MQQRNKARFLHTYLIPCITLLFLLVLYLYQTDSKDAIAQETYDYSLNTPLYEEVISDTFSKSQGHLPSFTVGSSIGQSATVGKPVFILFGFGPSETKIAVSGIGVADVTTSGSDGYFEFTNLYLPTPRYSILEDAYVFPEVCVQAIAGASSSQPTCIPSLAVADLSTSIGPVLVSPILTLENQTALLGEQVLAQGKTTPNTQVIIHLAKKNYFESFSLVKKASASWLPEYEVISDANGYFEFTLPTTDNGIWNLFATANINGYNSPKGTTLQFRVLSAFWINFLNIIAFMKTLKAYLYPLFILLEIAIVVLLAKNIYKKRGRVIGF